MALIESSLGSATVLAEGNSSVETTCDPCSYSIHMMVLTLRGKQFFELEVQPVTQDVQHYLAIRGHKPRET